LFASPLHLIGKLQQDKFCKTCEQSKSASAEWSFALLSPRDPIDCDLGNGVRLPSAGYDVKGLRTLTDCHLKTKDFEVLLAGGDPKDILPIRNRKLWDHEYWVGLQRNCITLTTEDRALFSKHHIRMAPGVSLMMLLECPEELADLETLVAMGGESRTAFIRIINEVPKFPSEKGPELKVESDRIQFTVTHLTPACLGGNWPGPGGHLPGVPGKVISACLERPIFLGGWDSIGGGPLPLRPYVPSGSTWFCEADSGEIGAIKLLHLNHIGEETNCGFGQITIGLW
jgi:CRISPR-associated protein Cmr3